MRKTTRPLQILLARLVLAGIASVCVPALLLQRGWAFQDSVAQVSDLAVLRAELEAARAASAGGDHQRARELVGAAIERALLGLGEEVEAPRVELLAELGRFAQDSGHLRAAEQAYRSMLEVRERTLPAEHPELQWTRGNLAVTRYSLGDLHGARALFEAVLEIRERTLPAEHPDLQAARQNLAGTMASLGDLHGAQALEEAVLEVLERTLPAEHAQLQTARLNLAATIKGLGDLHGARALEEAVLEVLERTLPADHPDLQWARGNLAGTMASLGDLQGARALFEAVLEVRERSLPAEHPELQRARFNLAATIKELGDLQGARSLEEAVLEVWERTLPAEHPDLQAARQNLAGTIRSLGDLQGARSLEEAVLEVLERTLPAEHPDLQAARQNLAATMDSLGDLQGARALLEAVLELSERTLPAEHPDLQRARQSLAVTICQLGDLHGARSLEEAVLEVFERTLPAEHPDLQRARQNLAATRYSLGDLHGARALFEAVLEVRERTLPAEHPDLHRARQNLAVTTTRLAAARRGEKKGEESVGREEGDDEQGWPRALALVAQVARGRIQAARQVLGTASVREAEERIGRGAQRSLGRVLSFGCGYGVFAPDQALLAEAFALSESTRAAALASAGLARAEFDPRERERLRAEILGAGAELAGLAQRGATAEEYHRARSRREAAERGLLDLAREQAAGMDGVLEVDAASLARVLDADTALVGYRRYERWWLEERDASGGEPAAQFVERSRDSLGAFVLRASGGEPELSFVDLGGWSEVDESVQAWRGAIGVGALAADRSGDASDGGRRGVGLAVPVGGSGLAEALALRRLLWDPLWEALGDARRVIVALDDVLHLFALDALPLDADGELLGDRWRIEIRLAPWELLARAPAPVAEGRLVILGGAAFGAEPLDATEEEASQRDEPALLALAETSLESRISPGSGAPASARASLLRGSPYEAGFAPLPFTATEMRSIAALHAELWPSSAAPPARLLTGPRASRAALERWAPGARWLHLATHGWFAPESVRSWADRDPEQDSILAGSAWRASGEETVRGMSPMLLCGLALAGANLPADSVGRVPGLVTAEELSGLDLTGCELAVLSACDTNVGERRAGQGVASLQKALHMAGARSVITSLWKVPDQATSELMLDFYRRLWVEQKPKHQALWEAKRTLRAAKDERGNPLYTTRDWAAWVLTGEPD